MTTPATSLLWANGHPLPSATSTCPRCGAAISDATSRQPWGSAERWAPPTAPPSSWYPPGSGPYPLPPPVAGRATNGLAVAAMVLGILWIWWVGSILALVFGYIALRQIRASNQSGRGMAVAGIVLGWVGLAVAIVGLIGAAATAGDQHSASSTHPPPGSTSAPLPSSSMSPGVSPSPAPTLPSAPTGASAPIRTDGVLSSQIVPPPLGFSLSQRVEADNGTLTGADFDRYVSDPGAAANLHYLTGYELTYDNNQTRDSILITLLQFATPADASAFQGGFSAGGPTTSEPGPAIPGADDFDATAADAGTYDQGVIATKGPRVFVLDYFDRTTGPAIGDPGPPTVRISVSGVLAEAARVLVRSRPWS